jgi:plastocyanin
MNFLQMRFTDGEGRTAISMARRLTLAASMLVLALVSGLTMALPPASAQSCYPLCTVVVSIPKGAGSGQSAAPGYAPDNVVVVIGVNNTVMWTNNDTAAHTVIPGNEPAGGGWSVGSGNLPSGMSYSFTFTVPGTYAYSCSYHSWMSGTVVVKAATSTTTSTTPEFPAASLALIFFAVIAAVMLAVPRLRPSRVDARSI